METKTKILVGISAVLIVIGCFMCAVNAFSGSPTAEEPQTQIESTPAPF